MIYKLTDMNNINFSDTFIEMYGFVNLCNLDARNEFTFEVFCALLKRDSPKFNRTCKWGSKKLIYNSIMNKLHK